jgi:hypothetical protein
MTGYAASVQAGKVAGNWVYGMDFFAYSPGFEVNDAGFETTTDRVFHGVRLSRRWLSPGTVFRSFRIDGTWAQSWNFGGDRQYATAFLGTGGQLRNYWNFNLGFNYNFGGQSDKATRGGPLMEAPRQWSANAFLGTDGRKAVSGGAFGFYARNVYGGFGASGGGWINFRPTSAMSIAFEPNYSYTHSMGFYVTARDDSLAMSTFGQRYVFSELVQNTLNLSLRLNLSVTPDLSIELWAQPFVASGDYQGFKELERPGTFDFLRYGRDGSTLDLDANTNVYTADPDGSGPAEPIAFGNPDFRFRSLRSNLVIRWEYRPGSTLFVVWNHGRSGFAANPEFKVLDELGNLFRDDMRNTLLVKFNYRIMM